MVHGVEVGGLLKLLADQLVAATGGNMAHAGYAILWASAVLSAIVDNIPFVATMIPLIKSMAACLWWTGQDRAVVVVPVARRLPGRQRHPDRGLGQLDGGGAWAERGGKIVGFVTYTLYAFPMMLVSVAVSHIYVWWRYF